MSEPAMLDQKQAEAALALLRRIRYHAERHILPRDWLDAADEVLGTWGPVKTTHPGIEKAEIERLRAALTMACERMERARGLLTDNHPRYECNWGMLDTSDLRTPQDWPERVEIG